MTDLTPMAALGATPARASYGPLTLVENPSVTLLSLSLPEGATTELPGLSLPGPGHFASGTGAAALWLSPGQWMLETASPEALGPVLAGLPEARVTDQSDGWVLFRIQSETGAAPLIHLAEKLVNLPADRLAPGCATRTLLHHLGCIVIRTAEDRLVVMTLRSAAGSLWHALTETASRLSGDVAT